MNNTFNFTSPLQCSSGVLISFTGIPVQPTGAYYAQFIGAGSNPPSEIILSPSGYYIKPSSNRLNVLTYATIHSSYTADNSNSTLIKLSLFKDTDLDTSVYVDYAKVICGNLCSGDGIPLTTCTPTKSLTPTPTVTSSITPTVTQTPSITPTNTITPTITPTNTFTPTVSVTPSPTETPTPTYTSTVTVTQTPTNTNTSTPTNTINLTRTPTPTNTTTATESPTPTPTITTTVTSTSTPTNTYTSSQTPTPTLTSSITPTVSITPSMTNTVDLTRTPTPTVTSTAITPTPTSTSTSTPTPSITNSPTSTPTVTSTPTKTTTPTQTKTPTRTPTPTLSITPTISITATNTASPTQTPSVTPSQTATPAPTLTPLAKALDFGVSFDQFIFNVPCCSNGSLISATINGQPNTKYSYQFKYYYNTNAVIDNGLFNTIKFEEIISGGFASTTFFDSSIDYDSQFVVFDPNFGQFDMSGPSNTIFTVCKSFGLEKFIIGVEVTDGINKATALANIICHNCT